MIKSVTAVNFKGESIKMDLFHPESSGFIIIKIDGIGPGKATVTKNDSKVYDGGTITSARLPSRNIKMEIQFLWVNSIEDVRHKSYKYFPLKKPLTLIFETDTRTVEIEGVVESNEPDIFSSEESTNISIICPDPYFYASGENARSRTEFSGINPMFEIPSDIGYSNESITEALTEISTLYVQSERGIMNYGEVDIGVVISIKPLAIVKGILTISNVTLGQNMSFDLNKIKTITEHDFHLGDELVINTLRGKKSVTLVREGKNYNALSCIDTRTDWIYLTSGENTFTYYLDGEGIEDLQFSVTNSILYEGV